MTGFPEPAQTVQVFILAAMALVIGARAFELSARWRHRALVAGACCLGLALVLTVVTWDW